jgi:hypothetical protein
MPATKLSKANRRMVDLVIGLSPVSLEDPARPTESILLSLTIHLLTTRCSFPAFILMVPS